MQGNGLIALAQPGEWSVTAGLWVVGLLVVGFLLLEVLYLAACSLFLAGERRADRHRRKYRAHRLGLLFLVPLLGLQEPAAQPPTPAGLDEYLPVPEDNPLTPAKVALGRRLFFDPILSRDSTVACASCHRPEHWFSDTTRVSLGVGKAATFRNAPTLLNRAYGRTLFWDGRAATLEAAVLQPVRNAREMDQDPARAVARLAADRGYAAEFDRAFGAGPSERDLARALASFLRTLRSGDSPVDRFLAGDRAALSEEAKAGLRIFAGRGNCFLCHNGATFTDERLHNTGVSWGGDPGRFAVTGDSADRGAFKSPTLRNVARTAPYMHDGSLPTLEVVIEFYDRGGNPNPNIDREIRPLRLSPGERQALLAFLKALTSP